MSKLGKVNETDTPISHATLLKELCEVLERRECLPTRLDTYRRAVEVYPADSLKAVMSELYAQSPMATHLPSPDELRSLVRKYAPRPSTRANVEEERWRRRYDLWQQGQFTDAALDIAFSLSDVELGLGQESDATYLHCQHTACVGLVSWPTDRTDQGRMFCPRHQPGDERHPATPHDKLQILMAAPPKARAYLRSCIPNLMADIPVTEEEAKYTEAELPRNIPPKLAAHLATVDGATAAALLANYHDRNGGVSEINMLASQVEE